MLRGPGEPDRVRLRGWVAAPSHLPAGWPCAARCDQRTLRPLPGQPWLRDETPQRNQFWGRGQRPQRRIPACSAPPWGPAARRGRIEPGRPCGSAPRAGAGAEADSGRSWLCPALSRPPRSRRRSHASTAWTRCGPQTSRLRSSTAHEARTWRAVALSKASDGDSAVAVAVADPTKGGAGAAGGAPRVLRPPKALR